MINNLRIKSMKLHEFLGATGELVIDFNSDLTEFIGDNGKGKSLILNAIAFLLTGKDAFGQNRVFYSNNGSKEAFTYVEAEVVIGNEDVVLKRLLQRTANNKNSTSLWRDHQEVKQDDWKANFDSDAILSIINPKYLSQLKPADLKKLLIKFLNMNDIDIEDLMMEIFDEVEGTDFDEFTEIIELYNELGDIDSVATHIQDNLKVVKGAIKETKATIKAFEEKPAVSEVPFRFKIGKKMFFSEVDAYNAVETALLTDVEANINLLRTFSVITANYALANKKHNDWLAEEKANTENKNVLEEYRKQEALIERQVGYIERLNEKIIENLNTPNLKKQGVSFEFEDIFSKKAFNILYKGNPIMDCSYAEQVTASIILSDYLMTYLGLNYPIFVDNSECITKMPTVDKNRQLVSMQVAEGYELSVYTDTCIKELKTLKTMPRVNKGSLIKTRIVGGAFNLSE